MTFPFGSEVSLLRPQSQGWLKLGHHTGLEAGKRAPHSMSTEGLFRLCLGQVGSGPLERS